MYKRELLLFDVNIRIGKRGFPKIYFQIQGTFIICILV